MARRNRKALRSAGVCVWLTAPADELYRRMAADKRSDEQRPSLTNLPGLQEAETALQTRLPIYEATADYVVNTADRSVEQVVETVLQELGVSARAMEGS